MINDLESVDWSSMSHAYGSAHEVPVWLRAMASADAGTREKAFGDYYSAAHHQGDVYPCTAASLPFLFALADDTATPDRGAVVHLLLSIGREAVDCGDDIIVAPDGSESTAAADSVAMLRERSDAFLTYAQDPDPWVRRAGIEGLGLFVEDADRAFGALRERLPAEAGTVERLLVVHTAATLALRLPAARTAATAWLAALADDPTTEPDIRLAAVVHHARCGEDRDDAVPTAIALLRRLATAPERGSEEAGCRVGSDSGACACRNGREGEGDGEADTGTDADAEAVAQDGVPPQVTAAFEDLDRHGWLHAPTTTLLRTFHTVLDARVPERTALLTEQLRSPDPAVRYDAIRMAQDLITSWRGEHTGLVLLLADCLTPEDPYTAAAAAESLRALGPVGEPAREALAAQVAANRTTHGPNAWAATKTLPRRAHQEAVMALAALGDPRALPCLLTALDDGTDAWRAVQVAGRLRPGAGELVPRLSRHLAAADLSNPWADMGTGALMSALAELGDAAAVPALTDAVTAAIRHDQPRIGASALKALAAFGTEAASALDVVRPLADAADVSLRAAAAAALWALERDPADVVPRLCDLLDTHAHHDAADVLGLIGPPAAAALPRLRTMLTAGYEWTRVHAARALWDIAGEAEADVVVRTLLAAWAKNDATSNHVLACLDRMGPAAAPALPRIRAELAQARRSGRFGRVANDEDLQRTCRTVLARLS
ncbi:HEAT repeat domain-containing protein [Kitasatospora sp. NPDC101447]|uniref:HEAT repeat domain-containing protein n=1 Tax=Kitasatospora sp. NPDC101447 TaxID=3364102 RepID=UPI0037F24061